MHQAVREAGALALSYFGGNLKNWKKPEDSTPVSEADLAVDALLLERLHGARPDYGWLSEETEDDPVRLDRRRTWIVDPIDGTRAFLKGLPHFAVAVALVEEGQPVLAAVFNPASGEYFAARQGAGTTLDGVPVTVTDRSDLAGCRMAGFAGLFRHKSWREPWPDMDILERNSMAYRLALVAAGLADATVTLTGKSDWDLAAAHLLVEEAGGRVSDHRGRPIAYNRANTRHQSLIAAGPSLHETLLRRVEHVTLP